MERDYPLFRSHIDLAHKYWKELLQCGDHAIDATCGNGKDTLVLAQLLLSRSPQSTLIGIDIQAEALKRTHALLSSHLTEKEKEQVHLFHQSHATFPLKAYHKPIRLIVYNFGYLPQADKSITTMRESSIQSFQAALSLLMPGGAISATCYSGHEEGAREQEALFALAQTLEPSQWCVTVHAWTNRSQAPTLLFVQKRL